MKVADMFGVACLGGALLTTSGCAANRPQVSVDLPAGLEVATVVEAAYAARPNADSQVVAEAGRLLASAQAAVSAWEASTSSANQAVAAAAVAALMTYEATAAKSS